MDDKIKQIDRIVEPWFNLILMPLRWLIQYISSVV